MALATVPGGWLSDRIGIPNTIRAGLVLAVAGFALMGLTWTIDIDNALLAAQMAIVGVGIGLTFSPISAAVINSAADSERGVAGAIVLILRLVGMTISVASLSSIMLSRINYLANLNAVVNGVFDASVYAQTYVDSAVQVLREIGFLGALLCLLALLPTLLMTRQQPAEA
jgi:MFS family permease